MRHAGRKFRLRPCDKRGPLRFIRFGVHYLPPPLALKMPGDPVGPVLQQSVDFPLGAAVRRTYDDLAQTRNFQRQRAAIGTNQLIIHKF